MRYLRIGTLAAALLACGLTAAEPAKNEAFERFKALAGDWVAAEDGPMAKKGDLVVQYRLTASGTAVVEDVFPGTEHAMTTVYHLDGKDLVLTHYCMEGNQPRMRAKNATGAKIAFAFDGGTNIDAKHTRHMNNAQFEFIGKDELKSQWIELEEGKNVFTANMHIVRKTS